MRAMATEFAQIMMATIPVHVRLHLQLFQGNRARLLAKMVVMSCRFRVSMAEHVQMWMNLKLPIIPSTSIIDAIVSVLASQEAIARRPSSVSMIVLAITP
jgi:hypothetical protein